MQDRLLICYRQPHEIRYGCISFRRRKSCRFRRKMLLDRNFPGPLQARDLPPWPWRKVHWWSVIGAKADKPNRFRPCWPAPKRCAKPHLARRSVNDDKPPRFNKRTAHAGSLLPVPHPAAGRPSEFHFRPDPAASFSSARSAAPAIGRPTNLKTEAQPPWPHPPSVFTYMLRYRITTTFVPTLTRSERSTTSWLVIRMQPDDTAAPIVSGSFDP